MAKTNKGNEDLKAKMAAISEAGSTAMHPAVAQAMEKPAEPPQKRVASKPHVVEELVKITVRLTNDENRKLIRFRNDLSEQHGQALNTTDILRMALLTFDAARVTPETLAHVQSTDRRRKAD